MVHGASLSAIPRAAAAVSLVCLTVVLVLLGMVFARAGPGIWLVAALIGIPSWLAFAILERSDRWAS